MALKKIINVEGEAYVQTLNGRVAIRNQKTSFMAYCKIINIYGNKESCDVMVECSDDDHKVNMQYVVPFSVAVGSENFIRQAYIYLKTLPEFQDAIDC
jgi:hypothetical protein